MNLKWVFDIITSYKNDPDISIDTLLTLEDLENTLINFIKESNKLNGNS